MKIDEYSTKEACRLVTGCMKETTGCFGTFKLHGLDLTANQVDKVEAH